MVRQVRLRLPGSQNREMTCGRRIVYSTMVTAEASVAPLNVKTTLNVKTAKCEQPNNR